MKRLFFALILVAGTLAVANADAQPHFRGRVGFGFPHAHAFYAPVRPAIIYPPIPVPYYGGALVAGGPATVMVIVIMLLITTNAECSVEGDGKINCI